MVCTHLAWHRWCAIHSNNVNWNLLACVVLLRATSCGTTDTLLSVYYRTKQWSERPFNVTIIIIIKYGSSNVHSTLTLTPPSRIAPTYDY